MRFYDNSWHEDIVSAIETCPRAIYCCRCKPIDFETGEDMDRPMGYGAYINISQPEKRDVLGLTWIASTNIPAGRSVVEIPCILGACYAATFNCGIENFIKINDQCELWNIIFGKQLL